jgi:hypothetical protein
MGETLHVRGGGRLAWRVRTTVACGAEILAPRGDQSGVRLGCDGMLTSDSQRHRTSTPLLHGSIWVVHDLLGRMAIIVSKRSKILL